MANAEVRVQAKNYSKSLRKKRRISLNFILDLREIDNLNLNYK